MIRTIGSLLRPRRFTPIRCITSTPFGDDLSPVDNELLGLEDFQHYNESPQVGQMRSELAAKKHNFNKFEEAVTLQLPIVFVSKLSDPFLNLAIEDYIYNKMPLSSSEKFNRLLFYINSPCVVIGKNQNPWKEANIPLLTSVQIPLLRRRSGGGTVVHDSGNVNFSFMTTKKEFSRFKFVELVCQAVNTNGTSKYGVEVNERGDITTTKLSDGINYKVSGSAYKLSKGKSYHHGTMLLNLKLDILGQLLSTSPEKNGQVTSSASVASVKAKVLNIQMETDEFINCVSERFKSVYGEESILTEEEKEYNEMMGIEDFIDTSKTAPTFIIDENTPLNETIYTEAEHLRLWEWRFGSTPKFTHEFVNNDFGLSVRFQVRKGAIIEGMELDCNPELEESFLYLKQQIEAGNVLYKGSEIAGLVLNDKVSEWLGECIDGTL